MPECTHIDHIRFGPTEEYLQELDAEQRKAVDRLVESIRKEREQMARTVRCKFRCNSVNKEASQGSRQIDDPERPGQKKWENYPRFLYGVKMSPVYSDKPDSENKAFWDATPQGNFEMASIHEAMFEPGKEYYLDITPAE